MSTTSTRDVLSVAKPHFAILDGMRGIAAFAVVIYHFMEIVVPDYTQSFIAHAHLAVDFFFCLSGFVIAYAYDRKLKQIGLKNFFKLRLIRLHPLVIIGALIGLLAFVFDPFSVLFRQYATRSFLMFVCSCLMIPFPMVPERYFNLFHLNPPMWSLFWEYLANIAYALILIRLQKRWMWMLLAFAAAALIYESVRSGYLGVGWGGDNFLGGGIRILFSFTAGILIYRCNWIIPSRFGFWYLALLLAAAFFIPFRPSTNAIVDVLVVMFYFPFLIALGAGAALKPSIKPFCNWSGAVSYPLYMIHYPFIWLFMSYVERYKPNLTEMSIIIISGSIALVILAHAILYFIDQPIREYLKKRFIH